MDYEGLSEYRLQSFFGEGKTFASAKKFFPPRPFHGLPSLFKTRLLRAYFIYLFKASAFHPAKGDSPLCKPYIHLF